MSGLDMKMAILKEFKLIIQEVSPDFMLIPPQKCFSFDDEHRIVDLLFYHRNIQCLIPVYLKFGDLHIDDIEWMKLNLRALDEHKMQQDDEKPIGFILCVQDNAEHVELVQQEEDKGWISKNLIKPPLRQIFKATLRNAVRQVRKQIALGEVYGVTS